MEIKNGILYNDITDDVDYEIALDNFNLGIKMTKTDFGTRFGIMYYEYNIPIKKYCNLVLQYCKIENIKIEIFKPDETFNSYALNLINKTDEKFIEEDLNNCYNKLYTRFRNELNFAIPKIASGELNGI